MKQFKRYFFFPFILCGLIFFTNCHKNKDDIFVNIENAQPFPLSAVSLYDISYGDNSRNKMDIFLPENRNKNTPVLILVHGGSWYSGDKSSMHEVAEVFMQSQQMAVVCMNYRFIPDFSLPAQMEDIKKVIETIRTKQPEWHTSDNYFYLMGVSAGAHLSLLYSYGYDYYNVIKGVISLCGPTNFDLPELIEENPGWNLLISVLVGGTYEDSPDAWRTASPYYHVISTTCPTILAHCQNDSLVPYTQATMLYDKLLENNIATQFFSYPTGGHAFEGVDLTEILEASENMVLSK